MIYWNPEISQYIYTYVANDIVSIWVSECLGLLRMGESWILNHCVYGVYLHQLGTSAAPSMSKYPDYRIGE